MKTLLLTFLFTLSLFGGTLNESLLKIHATLVPKIYLMDYNFKDKLINNAIVIAIVYKKSDYQSAKELEILIKNRYKKGIKSYKVIPMLVSYVNESSTKANIYYLFPNTKREIQKVIKTASKNNALTFSYDREDLKYGIMISLSITKQIRPILNLKAVKLNNISLRPVLIDISSIFKNDIGSSIDSLHIRVLRNTRRYWV